LKHVLSVGIKSIWEWAKDNKSGSSIKSIVVFAYLDEELDTLFSICKDFDAEFKRSRNDLGKEGEISNEGDV
jgi:hypothetical protein